MKKLLTSYVALSLITFWAIAASGAPEERNLVEISCQKDCSNQRKIDCSDLRECEKQCKKSLSEAVQTYLIKAKEICDFFTKNKSTPYNGGQ